MKLLHIAPLLLLALVEAAPAPAPASASQFYTDGQINKMTRNKYKNSLRAVKKKQNWVQNIWSKIAVAQHNEKKALNAGINADQVEVKNFMQAQKEDRKESTFDSNEFESKSKNIERCLTTVAKFNAASDNFNFASVEEARDSNRVDGLGADYCNNDDPCQNDAAFQAVCESFVDSGITWNKAL